MILTVSGCGGTAQDKKSAEPAEVKAEDKAPVATQSADKKILILYYSRTGEEYGLGNITKGNTEIVAEYLAKKTGADMFEIKPAKPYPDAYEPCTEIAKLELESNARPAFASNIDNLAQYDTVFIGYPIWWGALPRVVLTFLEANDFTGKTIVPFCTHGGSGLSGTERELADACPNAKVLSGLAIVGKSAQNDFPTVEKDIDAWLTQLGY
ncbi:MAG: NAD(P)H-dependent oxidoreductase [Selenomonadaceae bacterium]|nr:NAD(P)H-dependent oxidoreductase [Selenomonadaceae bacterium]